MTTTNKPRWAKTSKDPLENTAAAPSAKDAAKAKASPSSSTSLKHLEQLRRYKAFARMIFNNKLDALLELDALDAKALKARLNNPNAFSEAEIAAIATTPTRPKA